MQPRRRRPRRSERFDLRFRFGVRSAAEQKREARVVYWTTQVFFGLLLAVAVVISVFALIASMATAVIERRWRWVCCGRWVCVGPSCFGCFWARRWG